MAGLLTPQADGLYHTPASRGWGLLTVQGLVEHIVRNAVVGLIIATVLSFFEEIGWRAWLLPRLVDRLGGRRVVMVTAIIWGFWHVPFQLSGIQHIDGISPVKLAITFPFGIMIIGFRGRAPVPSPREQHTCNKNSDKQPVLLFRHTHIHRGHPDPEMTRLRAPDASRIFQGPKRP